MFFIINKVYIVIYDNIMCMKQVYKTNNTDSISQNIVSYMKITFLIIILQSKMKITKSVKEAQRLNHKYFNTKWFRINRTNGYLYIYTRESNLLNSFWILMIDFEIE